MTINQKLGKKMGVTMLIFPPHLCELAVLAQKRHFFKFRPQCDMVVGHFGKKNRIFSNLFY